MRDVAWANWQANGVTPKKYSVEDEKAGELCETGQNASLPEAALKRSHEI